MCNTFMYVQPEASVREIAELTLEKKKQFNTDCFVEYL